MVTERRRGRPSLPEAEKRQQIGVRTSPMLKTELERAAAESGRSVAQEAELRLVQSFERERISGSPETDRLLASLAVEIALIERRTGKRWWRDLATWAAVSEAMRTGPIRRMKPDQPFEDDVVQAAWAEVWRIRQSKQPLLALLRDAGIAATDVPARFQSDGSQLSTLIALGTNGRAQERAQVAALHPAGDISERLKAALEKLVELDGAEINATQQFLETLKPYDEAEEAGIALYRDTEAERRARDEVSGRYIR